jgi:hypothetical protein
MERTFTIYRILGYWHDVPFQMKPKVIETPCSNLKFITADSLDDFQHGRGASDVRVVVPSRIIWAFRNFDSRDNAINNVKSKSLASIDQSKAKRARMSQFHLESTSNLAVRICHEGQERIFRDSLIFSPPLHNGAIVDTENDDLRNSSCRERV